MPSHDRSAALPSDIEVLIAELERHGELPVDDAQLIRTKYWQDPEEWRLVLELFDHPNVEASELPACQTCHHRTRPGLVIEGYCARRGDLAPVYGEGHPLPHLPIDGGACCKRFEPWI